MKNNFPLTISAGFLLLVGALAVWLSSCNHGSNIPIDPTCVDLVTDECVPEVIEEFCEECVSETDIILRTRSAYMDGFHEGYLEGVDSVECVHETDVTIIIVHPEEVDGEECDLSIPVGHRPVECRKNR